jgi:hypothetical protein
MLKGFKITKFRRTDRVLNQWRKYLVQQSKSRLSKSGSNATGELYGSVRGYIDKKFNRDVKGRFTGGRQLPSMHIEFNSYGQFIDKGVQGTKSNYIENRNSPYRFGRNGDKKAVPTKAISKWVAKKGLPKSLTYVIARSIYQKGIKATQWFSRSLELSKKRYLSRYHIAVADDIAENVADSIKKRLQNKNITK